MGMVRFPKFAPWWPDAEHELLMAFNGKNDDFVDALAHLAAGIDKMVRPQKARADKSLSEIMAELRSKPLTWGEVKRLDKSRKQSDALALGDN